MALKITDLQRSFTTAEGELFALNGIDLTINDG
jgi:ABC-type dipeptide/oligopeptide/nickel transport system ATPase component